MPDEPKVAEVPVPEKVETPADESLIDNRRTAVENQVIAANETYPEPEEVPEELVEKPITKEEPEVEEPDQITKIKQSVQKRIDKVVAKQKSAEEKLAEVEAELARLKASPNTAIATPKDDTPPTPEQVEAYILKMREEGNAKEEIAATRYLIKLEKEIAIKEVRDEQEKASKEAKAREAQELSDWTSLQKDYVVYTRDGKVDAKADLNLSNQSGLLYKTALALYQDKELHAEYYNDPNTIMGFRRAVADAYREIHQQGLIKTPKGEPVMIEKRTPRQVLAEPEAESAEEPAQSTQVASLSDAEKVREEIKARKKNRFIRQPS